MTDVERRLQTSYREGASAEPGLALGDDGSLIVILPDGTRRTITAEFLDRALSGPISLSFPFAGANANAETLVLALVAPYDGHITYAGYAPVADITFASGKSREWTLENADGDVLFSVALDDESDGMEKDVVFQFDLADLVFNGAITNRQPLYFRSAATNGPADPGGLLVLSFVDPVALDLGLVITGG